MSSVILTNWVGEIGMPIASKHCLQGEDPLHCLVEATKEVERNPKAPFVGVGGLPNMLGEMELDSAVMDGDTLEVGAVGALRGYASAVEVAHQLLKKTPHVLLVSDGAARFARECGIMEAPTLDPSAAQQYRAWKEKHFNSPDIDPSKSRLLDIEDYGDVHDSERDTVVFLMCGSDGRMVGVTATSGWAYKYPGRLGDSPIVGAGLYVDSAYGACACTHTGEMNIRSGTARTVVLAMKHGRSVEEACEEGFYELARLKGGYLGTVVIHAMDPSGNTYVAVNSGEEVDYYLWAEEEQEIKKLQAVRVKSD